MALVITLSVLTNLQEIHTSVKLQGCLIVKKNLKPFFFNFLLETGCISASLISDWGLAVSQLSEEDFV